MAVWENASGRANRAQALFGNRKHQSSADASMPEPEVANKWHPRWTLAFIVGSCGLLWGGIFALTRAF